MLPKPVKDPEAVTRVTSASFEAGAPDVASLPGPALAEVAFAGRSNVGKSSLLNAIMDRKKLVRTSNTPGCTRQINVFKVAIDGGAAFNLVDLPGYGYAKISKSEKHKWGPMLEGYIRRRPTLRAVVLIVDVRRGVEEEDRQLIEFLRGPREVEATVPIDVIVVATKLDKLAPSKQKPALEVVKKESGIRAIGFSAVTHAGREPLWARIRKAVLAS